MKKLIGILLLVLMIGSMASALTVQLEKVYKEGDPKPFQVVYVFNGHYRYAESWQKQPTVQEIKDAGKAFLPNIPDPDPGDWKGTTTIDVTP